MKKRIVFAPNAYKGTLSASRAAHIMASAALEMLPAAVVIEKPMADGGDGTSLVLAQALGGEVSWATAPDPFGRSREAHFVSLGDDTYAVDVSSASGLSKISIEERNVLRASSEGSGVLCRGALDRGAKKILLGVGGTAFLDGGTGMLRGLGVKFLDKKGHPIPQGAAGLTALESVDLSEMDPRCKEVKWILALDVSNPLFGSNGAIRVYGPQKGATLQEIPLLEKGLAKLADIVEKRAGQALRDLPGMGAGGGLPLVMKGFLGAEMEPGGPLVARWIGLKEAIRGSDLVLTGEGCIDDQTRYGKAPAVVAEVAASVGVPVAAVAGKLGKGFKSLSEIGIHVLVSTSSGKKVPSMRDAEKRLVSGTKRVLRKVFPKAVMTDEFPIIRGEELL